MVADEEILKELRNISKIITISSGPAIEKELEKYATSEDRKKIWVLLDGVKQSDEIAKIIGKTRRAVDTFLKILEEVGLVERPYNKPPIRRLDYVPASWAEFLEKTISTEESKESETQEDEQNG